MANSEQHGDLAGVKLESILKDGSCSKAITSFRVWSDVCDVMSKDVATVSPDQTVLSASMIMSERNISCVVVVDQEELVGILTETDLLKKILAKGQDYYEKPVGAVMTKSVESVCADVSVLVASRIMQTKHIKRLPILRDKQLVGIVTQTDLTRSLSNYGIWRDVAEIMSWDVCKIQSKESVAEAAQAMSSRDISSIVAMDNEEVVGVLTQRDLLTKVLRNGKDPQSTIIEEVMSSPPVCVPPSYSVFSASRSMENLRIRRLVVMEGKELCGIVTQTDVFTAIKDKLQSEEEKNLRLLEQSPSSIFTVSFRQGCMT